MFKTTDDTVMAKVHMTLWSGHIKNEKSPELETKINTFQSTKRYLS